jgi:serine protease Do
MAHAVPTANRRQWLAALAAAAWLRPGQARAQEGRTEGGKEGRSLPDLVAALRGSVLPVGIYNATDNPRFGFRGTGFVVGDGSLVATNFHVLPPGSEPDSLARLSVLVGAGTDSAGIVRSARLMASDPTHDLALLKIEGPPLPALTLGDSAAVREGQSIALMGFPIGGAFGFSPVTHRGIVASLTRLALPAPNSQQLDARAVARLREGPIGVLQLDATAYPGNSGGPVFDAASGQVVGVLSLVWVRGNRESALSQPTGISYAIPVKHLQALVPGR